LSRSFKILLLFVLSAVCSAPANASLQLSFGAGDVLASSVPASNDFRISLESALGVSAGGVMIVKSDVMATAKGTISFFAHASESGFINRFEILDQLIGGSSPFTETTDLNPWQNPALPFATISVDIGDALSSLVQFATNGGVTPAFARPGDFGFGIFLKSSATTLDNHTTLYFGYDDLGAGPDKDFDDLIIRAVFTPSPQNNIEEVPEPASIAAWGLLAGCAIGALVIRRRRIA
jgi:hypothetical protein